MSPLKWHRQRTTSSIMTSLTRKAACSITNFETHVSSGRISAGTLHRSFIAALFQLRCTITCRRLPATASHHTVPRPSAPIFTHPYMKNTKTEQQTTITWWSAAEHIAQLRCSEAVLRCRRHDRACQAQDTTAAAAPLLLIKWVAFMTPALF